MPEHFLTVASPNALHDAFQSLLEGLNPAQKAAVEQTEGPVLVLAGPGTGKTQVLAARIAYILLHTDTRPQNILCLTFTDAGVRAMRERLLGIIGPEAHQLPIATFHSFCNRVIQENGAYFGGELETASELEQLRLIRQMLDEAPTDHPLREGVKNQYHYETHLRSLFKTMKTEGWKPGEVRSAAARYVKSLPQQKEYIYQRNHGEAQKGDLKIHKIEAVRRQMERLQAAADLFPTYNRMLAAQRRYEYEDMLLWTIRAFEQHPDLLRNYQERFLYILVDEFQDTNGAQHQLLRQLVNYWDQPNIFIVGDDDQSIFEFQGARLHNLIDFYRDYQSGLLLVTLTENYRSAQAILDLSDRVIAHNQLRVARQFPLPVEKKLRAQTAVGARITQTLYPDRLSEDADLLRRVAALLEAGTPPTSIAVICAKHRQFDRLMVLMDQKGMAYQAKKPVNILEAPLVRQLISVLRYLNDEMNSPYSGEHRLFRILHAPFLQTDPPALATLALELQKTGVAWRDAIAEGPWPAAAQLALLPAAVEAGLVELHQKIFSRLGVLNWVLQQPDKSHYLQLLHTWLEFVRACLLRDPALSLSGLLDLIGAMQDNHIEIPFLHIIRMEGGIQLLTAHGAKGLEFEHVFIPDCSDDAWEPTQREQNRRFQLPPDLTYSSEEDAMEARRRLFYVALTRAKTGLYLSCSQLDYNGKPLTPARFWDETEQVVESFVPAPADLETALALSLSEAPPALVTLPDAALLREFLDGFALSAKSLNKYLRCPLAFYYEEVLAAPSEPSEAGWSGQAMHKALQFYFSVMQKEKSPALPDRAILLDKFAAEMARYKNRFRPAAWEQRLHVGLKNLDQYWAEQIPHWRKKAVVEYDVRCNERHSGAPLRGILDKIEFLDNGDLRVVDYKSGSWSKQWTRPPDAEHPLGGVYYRQLLFYKILLDDSRRFAGSVVKGALAWIEADNKGRFRQEEIAFSPAEVQWMRDLIQSAYARITALEFSPGCNDPACPWCEMQRTRSWTPSAEPPEEILDDPA